MTSRWSSSAFTWSLLCMHVLSKFPFLRRMPVTWIRAYSKDLILIALPLKDLISEYVYIILDVRASPYEMGGGGRR